MWLSSVWQCNGGWRSHLGLTGTGWLLCACCFWICPKTESLVCAWTSTCRTTAEGYVFDGTAPQNSFFFMLFHVTLLIDLQASWMCIWLLCPLFPHFCNWCSFPAHDSTWEVELVGATALYKTTNQCKEPRRLVSLDGWTKSFDWLGEITWPRHWQHWTQTWCCSVSSPSCWCRPA